MKPCSLNSTFIVVILVITLGWSFSQAAVESDEEDDDDPLANAQPCPGGYCVKILECKNGSINIDGDDILSLRFNVRLQQDDPCEEFLMKCCAYNPDESSVEEPPRSKPPVKPSKPPPVLPCGVNHPDGYIYHVEDKSVAQFAEFPWTVAILNPTTVFGKTTDVFLCGGSLIHPQVVMTTAHCLEQYNDPKQLKARLGEWDTVTLNEPLPHQQLDVKKIIVHEKAKTSRLQNDIALLVLSAPAKLNAHINTICLPNEEDNFVSNRCQVSGWGTKNFDKKDQYNEVLKKVDLPMVGRRKCQRNLRKTRLGPFFQLHESLTCAGGEEGIDACTGDGGSPLACARSDGRYVQTGIVAGGIGCGEKDVPGLYVDVRKFVDWIENAMESEGLLLP